MRAPHGSVTAGTVSGGGNIWNGAASGTLIEGAAIIQNGVTLDDFSLSSPPLGNSQVPAPGTPFTFTLTTASSSSLQYTVPSNSVTTETVSFQNLPVTGPLSSVIGKTVTYSWPLPVTFAIEQVDLFAYIYDGGPGNPATHSCQIDAGLLSQTATSAFLSIPANMSACGLSASDGIQQVTIGLEITGKNGEFTGAYLGYPY